jgi:UDP-N-acetylglucosamine acyltransferase
MIVEGSPAEVRGVNLVGLRRAGVPEHSRDALRKACRYMFFSEMNISQAIEKNPSGGRNDSGAGAPD